MLGQALVAAYATVENRPAHSMHAHFLRAGDPDHPINYQVDRSRDGSSLSSRRVVALQHGKQIFHMFASFQAEEEQAIESYSPMPAVAAPETLEGMAVAVEEFKRRNPDRPTPWVIRQRAFEFRRVMIPEPSVVSDEDPQMMIWLRAAGQLPPDPVLQHCLLAYVSDYYLMGAAALRLPRSISRRHLQVSSIDHAMWFHRAAPMDDWLLYALFSPNISGLRGLSRGRIYSRDGRLVASTAQEGLMRYRPSGGERPAL